MALNFTDEIIKIAEIDLFKRDDKTGAFEAGFFIGRPFHIDYDRAHILVADSWKKKQRVFLRALSFWHTMRMKKTFWKHYFFVS